MTMRARAASISADIAARYTASPMPIAPPITTPVAPINTASFAASQAALRAFGGGSASANLAALRPQFFAPPSGDPVPAAPNVVTVRFQTGGGDETIGEDEFLPGPFMPQELPKLIFDGENLLAYDPSTGDVLEEWSAVSGNPESTPDDLTEVNFGPIPEGGYTIDPDNSNRHRFWKIGWGSTDAWGNIRTLIEPNDDTKFYDRDPGSFNIHGGNNPGSAGCVDLTDDNEDFHDWLGDQSGPVELTVDYSYGDFVENPELNISSGLYVTAGVDDEKKVIDLSGATIV